MQNWHRVKAFGVVCSPQLGFRARLRLVMWRCKGQTCTFLVAHGDVGVEQRGEGALLGQLGFGRQGVVPQRLDQHGGQVQCLQWEPRGQTRGQRRSTHRSSGPPAAGLYADRVAFGRRLYLLGVRVGVQARH